MMYKIFKVFIVFVFSFNKAFIVFMTACFYSDWMVIDLKKKYFGDKAFYKMVLLVAVPIMIQNGFTNIINLLDNLMVGQIGTDQMSGVAIVNQLMFVFYLSVFGGFSGAGIFVAQFFGSKDNENIKNVIRMKFIIGVILLVAGIGVIYIFQEPLINMFLHDGSVTGDLEATMRYAKDYLAVMLIGLIPFVLSQCYTSTLRETGETILPMKAGIVAVLVNLTLNYILIFGKLGMPKMGVVGAAVATVISRIVECLIVIIWCKRHNKEFPFMFGIFKNFRIPASIIKNVVIKGMPLLVNEFLWSASVTMLTHCYSYRGLAAVAGINICNTLNNVFNIVFIAFGDAIAIIVGQLLGAGKLDEAKDSARKMRVFAVLVCFVIATLMAVTAPFFPNMYKTTDEVRHLATRFILIMACLMPVCAYNHAAYFTLRSGGKTIITFLFDSFFAWVVVVPTGLILAYKTNIPVVPMYLICQGIEAVKMIVAYILVKKDVWIQNLAKIIN